MTKPTALFLANILEDAGKPADIADKAAAELRRLHAELERCKQVCAATSEAWRADAEKWKDQRAVLLEALQLGYDSAKAEADQYHAAMAGYRPQRHAEMDAEVQQIAAAITALRAALTQEQPKPVAKVPPRKFPEDNDE